MKAPSKTVRRMLREWCGIAYRRELRDELAKLHDQFHQWENETLSEFELSDAIHKFHQGAARDLYVRYEIDSGVDEMLLAAAIANDVIKTEEIPSELLDAIKPLMHHLEEPTNS